MIIRELTNRGTGWRAILCLCLAVLLAAIAVSFWTPAGPAHAGPLSNDANLSDLGISTSSLSPVFAPGTTAYSANSNNPAANVMPFAEESHATITVNGAPVTSGNWSPGVLLNPGPNTITIQVTAQDGVTTRTYTINVTGPAAPPASSDANLSSLDLTTGGLAPVFVPGTTSYIQNVDNATALTQVRPITEEAHATTTVNGTPVSSGNWCAIPLSVGDNNISVVVTAQDGATARTYSIIVTRQPAAPPDSKNANLSSLGISTGGLVPAFAPDTTAYTSDSNNAAANVMPTAQVSQATITVNGAPVNSGNWSPVIPLYPGPNTITIQVTAQDGATTKTYTITVTGSAALPASSDANLSNLDLTTGVLSPAFATGTTYYTHNVDNATISTQVRPITKESHATITVNGAPVTSGNWQDIPLIVGDNTVSVVVTAQDGVTTRTYSIIVTRQPAVPPVVSDNANLSSLDLTTGVLSPSFAPGKISYTHNIENATISTRVRPITEESHATITINGAPVSNGNWSDIPLIVGDNNVSVVVTAQDGVTTRTYSIIVTRQPAAQPPVQTGQTVLRYYIGGSDYYVNDQIKSMDIAPIIKDDRTLLPIRYVAEPLGATVDWNPAGQKVTVTMNGKTIELWIDQNTASVNGVATSIDPSSPNVAPIVVPPGRTMLPLRFIAENLGCQVDWDQPLQEAKVTYPKP